MALESIGVKAIVDNIGGYLSDINKLNKATDDSAASIDRASKSSEAMSKALAGIGKVVAGLGLTGLFVGATKEAADFDKSLRNIQATAGLTDKQIDTIGKSMLDMSKDSTYSSQQIAGAMYDIVGGVQDASKWNAILTESLKTAAAGQADLKSTTSGLIFIMNAYGLSAKDASMVSDVLTRTVGVGVGTMDDFVNAMAPLAITAKTLSVDFKDLGAMTAFLTSKGVNASEATTELQSVMQALLKPTGAMKDAFAALGYSSGSAMLKALGFSGTLNALKKYAGGSTDALAEMFQRVEGFKGVLALTNGDFDAFNKNFQKGVKGATDLAKATQEKALTSHIQKLTSAFNELVIETGQKLLPSLTKIVDVVKDVITGLGDAGPTILLLAGALGVLTLAAGPLGTALAIILSPIGLIIAGVAALGLAFQTNFLGIRDFVTSAWNAIKGPIEAIGKDIATIFQGLTQGFDVSGAFADLGWQIKHGLEIALSSAGIDSRIVQKVIDAFSSIQTYVANVLWPALSNFFGWLGGIWNIVSPAFGKLVNWFTTEAIPGVLDFITGTIIPGVQTFIDTLIRIWNDVSPYLTDLFNWFVNDALPVIGQAASDFQTNIIQPLIDVLAGLWTAIQPGLASFYNWFVTDGMPAIKTIANDVWQNIMKPFIAMLENAWKTVQPGLEGIANFFKENGPTIAFVVGVVLAGSFAILLQIIKEVVNWLSQAIINIQKFSEMANVAQQKGYINPQTGEKQQYAGGTVGAAVLSQLFPNGVRATPRASGGSFGAGDLLKVGEGGPELVSFGQPGFVFPNAVSQMLSGMMAQASPAYAPAASYAYNNVYNQQQSMGDINFNGVSGTDDSVRRYALLRAMGRVR